MKNARHYQEKMALWLQRAQEAITRKDAKRAIKKFKKSQRRYKECYDLEVDTGNPYGDQHPNPKTSSQQDLL